VFTWLNKKKYTGMWAYGKFNGNGRLEWDNGDIYEGSYRNDKKHGFGCMKLTNGYKYIG
jgi:hypothetical protein